MKKLLFSFIVLVFLNPAILADVSIGVEADSDGINSFHLAIGEFYNVPEKEVVIVRERKIPDEQLPVVFQIAEKAQVNPSAIIKLRLKGMSWMEICRNFNLTAEIFYFEMNHNPGPPYGKAYGHFKNRKRNQWNKIELSDADIINFSNLRFLSVHYGYSPDEVIKMRHNGKKFAAIHKEVKAKKHHRKQIKKKITKKNHKAENRNKGKKGKG